MGGPADPTVKRPRARGSDIVAWALALAVLAGCDRAASGPSVTVFAASSTAPLFEDVAARYERETGVRVRLNFAASSTLARQIEGGARADVFVSAHPQWMDRLEQADRLAPGSRRDYLANGLVLAIPAKDSLGLIVNLRMDTDFDFAAVWTGRIAVGDPAHVPAGVYAKQALTTLGWWDDVRARVIPAPDVRAAARLVELGEASVAIVYASDAHTNPAIAAFATFPAESHDPIVYPVAVVRGAGEQGRSFVEALFAAPYAAMRAQHGFGTPGG